MMDLCEEPTLMLLGTAQNHVTTVQRRGSRQSVSWGKTDERPNPASPAQFVELECIVELQSFMRIGCADDSAPSF